MDLLEDLPPVAADFIDRLLQLDPRKRLGANGVKEIKEHPFFEGINWDTLLSEPMGDVFIPRPENTQDTSYFWGKSYEGLFEFVLSHLQIEKTNTARATVRQRVP